MVELVDAGDLKSPDREVVRVRVPLPVLFRYRGPREALTCPSRAFTGLHGGSLGDHDNRLLDRHFDLFRIMGCGAVFHVSYVDRRLW